MKFLLCFALPYSFSIIFAQSVRAEVYKWDQLGGTNIVGESSYTVVQNGETLPDIARKFDLGYDELIKANIKLDRWVPDVGQKILLPTAHILPRSENKGIVINLAELRLYFFPDSEASDFRKVYTYPISIGRMDWKTPLGWTKVAEKLTDPDWSPPASIRREHLAEDDLLPNIIPGGSPDNPLGHYALRLGIPGYLIHGTSARKEFGIGMRVTHGCIRMYPEDIEELYRLASVGTTVHFVDQPIRIGWRGASLYVAVTTPLREDEEDFEEYSHKIDVEEIMEMIRKIAPEIKVESELLAEIILVGDGIPVKVAEAPSRLPPAAKE